MSVAHASCGHNLLQEAPLAFASAIIDVNRL
jgi:hypothetical protein